MFDENKELTEQDFKDMIDALLSKFPLLRILISTTKVDNKIIDSIPRLLKIVYDAPDGKILLVELGLINGKKSD